MAWLFPRVLALILGLLVGGLLGDWLGQLVGAPRTGLLLGAMVGVVGLTIFDTLQGSRLMAWVRNPEAHKIQHGRGLWGELASGVQRALRVQQQLTVAERRRLNQFLTAIDASPNGVMMLDPNDQIVWMSAVAADHFGLDPQRDLLQRVTNLVRSPAFVQYMQSDQLAEGVVFPNPRSLGVLQVQVRVYGEGMKLVLSQDITERDRAEVMRRDFVANVSHEIRTPLTVLSGFIETMTQLDLSGPERKRVLELMAQQTVRMQALVDDLLVLAKLEGGPRPPMDQWMSVTQLLRRVQGDANSVSRGKHEFSFPQNDDPALEFTMIAGLYNEVLSALNNLVQNAIRYTPEKGRITVGWRVLSDGQGEFYVQDTGIGIDAEHIPRLTERFYRVDVSRARETGGTGLGLSIVKHVIQRHSGQLRISSEVGKGSCFELIFPVSRVRQGPEVAKVLLTPESSKA